MRSWNITTAAVLLTLCAASAPILGDTEIARSSGSESGFYVDLTRKPVYLRHGFKESFLETLPSDYGNQSPWIQVPPSDRNMRTIRISDLGLAQEPGRVENFTLLIPFELTANEIESIGGGRGVPGLHLASIADNWAIYINGVRVRQELHLNASGEIESHRGYRDVHFPFDSTLLKQGENILGIRIIGRNDFYEIGLRQVGPYYFAPYEMIERANRRYLEIILIGLYLFIGLYHLFIASIRRNERHYLYYSLFSISVSLYFLCRTHVMQWVIPDQFDIYRIEFISLYLLLPLVGAFISTLDGDPIDWATKGYSIFSLGLILSVLFLPIPRSYQVLTLWQISAFGMASYYFFNSLFYRFFRHAYIRHNRERNLNDGGSFRKTFSRELLETPKGNLLIGGIILFSTALFDILDALLLHMDLVLSKYGFFLFTMGTAFILANRFEFLHRRVTGLNQSLEKKIADLIHTSDKLRENERKYRSLFEGATDAVALLDKDLLFIETNGAAGKLFRRSLSGEAVGLESCLYTEDREGSLQLERLQRAVAAIRGGDDTADITLRINSPHGDPQALHVSLQYINDDLIMLRVNPEKRDKMIDFFVKGTEVYELENKLSIAGDISRKATAPLKKYLDEGTVEFLAVCLSEIIINAVEHGNLEITFDAKTDALRQQKRYFDFLRGRSKDPKFQGRRVRLEWSLSEERALFRVTDQGPGFDHRKFLRQLNDPANISLEHGRGLMMALSAFDSVKYNERGNQVLLIKQLRKATD